MARILLLEPNTVLAANYSAVLKDSGHDVVVVADAQGAINAADDKKPDLVILELQLKAHSGIEFLYEFRSYSEWQNVPVVVLSKVPVRDMAVPPQALKNLGIAAYYYKPHTKLAALRGVVGLALGRAAGQRPVTGAL